MGPGLQDARIAALSQQQDQLTADAVALQGAAGAASAALAGYKARTEALAARLEVAETERSELTAQLAAVCMEAGGMAGAPVMLNP